MKITAEAADRPWAEAMFPATAHNPLTAPCSALLKRSLTLPPPNIRNSNIRSHIQNSSIRNSANPSVINPATPKPLTFIPTITG